MNKGLHFLKAISVGVAAAAIGLVVLTGGTSALAQFLSDPLRTSRTAGPVEPSQTLENIDQVVESAGVEVRLVGAYYSAAETRLVLELHHPDLDEARDGRLFWPIFHDNLSIEGFSGDRFIDQALSRGAGGIEQRELVLPPVTDPHKEVAVEIGTLCLATGTDSPCQDINGPWRFEWLPGDAAEDTEAARVPVDQSRTADGITVAIETLEISNSGLIVFYTVSGPEYRSAAPSELEAVYPNGTIAPGTIRRGETGSETRQAIFPLPPEGTDSIVLRLSAVVTDAKRPAVVDVAIPPIDPAVLNGDAPTSVPLGQEVEVAGEIFVVTDMSLWQGRVEFRLQGKDPSRQKVIFAGLDGGISLEAEGKSVPVAGMAVGFTKDEAGSISPGLERFSFEGSSLLGMSNVRLTSPSVGTFHSSNWEFTVPLP